MLLRSSEKPIVTQKLVFDRCGACKRGAALQYSRLGCWAASALLSGCALGLGDDFYISNSVAGGGTRTFETGGKSAVAGAGGMTGENTATGGALASAGFTSNSGLGGSSTTGDSTATGGATEAGGTAATGGDVATGGADGGGTSATGGADGGGTSATGGNGARQTGGRLATGGSWASQAGGASTTGGASNSNSYEPVCDATVTKSNACFSYGAICYKTCGPDNTGYKSETCSFQVGLGWVYNEQAGCSFPAGDYSCYSVPISPSNACPKTHPVATQACSVPQCTVCYGGTAAAPQYYDSTHALKGGYCVCNDAGIWTCAGTDSWPCSLGANC